MRETRNNRGTEDLSDISDKLDLCCKIYVDADQSVRYKQSRNIATNNSNFQQFRQDFFKLF